MCQQAKEVQKMWKPSVGDYVIAKTSICVDDNEACTHNNPCIECLESSNIYVVSGHFKYSDSVGGDTWYFRGHSCVRGYGCVGNSLSCYVMNESGASNFDPQTSKKSDMLWLPRQDQMQAMLLMNNITDYYKLIAFNDCLKKEDNYSLEELWLMYYMYCIYKKEWTANKEWEPLK